MSHIQKHTDDATWTVFQIKVRIPRDDPRFAPMLRELEQVRGKRGRASPLPRMLAEWALIGWLMTRGQRPQ